MNQHSEATQPATSTPCWCLIFRGANEQAFIVASSSAITLDAQELGYMVDDLGLPEPEAPGFWLFEGMINFDGLDGVEYDSDQPLEGLSFGGAAARMQMHEANPPEE